MSVKKLFQEYIASPEAELSMTDKQINIISAAIEIFSEKGYAATTTSEIAKKAAVGEGTVFHHYKTKKDLLLAVSEYLILFSSSKTYKQDINSIFEHPYEKLEDFLRALIENRRSFAMDNVILIKVLFQEIPFQPELRVKLSNLLSPLLSKFVATIDKFKAQGEIVNIPSSSVVNLLFTSLFGYFFARYVAALQLNWNEEEEINYLIQYIKNGVSPHNTNQ